MVEIGGHPILWHIMKTYGSFGCREFVICLGYKGDLIKDFFLNYRSRQGSITVELGDGQAKLHAADGIESWTVHLLDTGYGTMTGGRIRRAAEFLGARPFFATYGDGVANIDVDQLLAHHRSHGKLATVTAVRPPARFGGLTIHESRVVSFDEKPEFGEGWINGGYMVFEPEIARYIEDDATILERSPLETLAREGQLAAYEHEGYWQCMDTVRDLTTLREAWDRGAPWKVW